jgi:hypothetical protein
VRVLFYKVVMEGVYNNVMFECHLRYHVTPSQEEKTANERP